MNIVTMRESAHYHLLDTALPWKYRLYAVSRSMDIYISLDIDAYNLRDAIKRIRAWGRFSKRFYFLKIRSNPTRY